MKQLTIAMILALSAAAAAQDEKKPVPGIHILHLKKARALEVEPLLTKLIQTLRARGGAEATLAADAKANVIVLVSDAEIRKAVEAIVAKLDQEAADAKAGGPVEMSLAELLHGFAPRLGRRFAYGKDLGLEQKRVVLPAVPEGATPEDLLSMLEAVLKSQSLFLLQSEGAPTLYTVEHAALACKKGLPVLGAADAIPAGDGVYTKTFKIKSPRDAQALLINLVSFPQACLSMESQGILLVSDYASNLRKFEKILGSLQ